MGHSTPSGITWEMLLPHQLELLVVSLARNTFKLCLGAFYRPPSSSSSVFDILCNAFLSVHHSHLSNLVILGDFNVNFDASHNFYNYLSHFLCSFSLSQVVKSPTHFSHCHLLHNNGVSRVVSLQLVPCCLPPTNGLDFSSRDMISALCSLTTVRHSIQYHTGYYCKSSVSTMSTH